MDTPIKDAIKPLPSDVPNTGQERDHAGKGGWNISAQEQMLQDCDSQPNYWRDRADLAMAYVDGKQINEDQQRLLDAEGMKDVRSTNLIGRVVRSICGTEAKTRTDIRVDGDDDEDMEVCEVSNRAMKEARRESKIDMGVSGAYLFQVCIGLGWLKIDRDPDPLNYPHRATVIDRRNIWWDFKAQHPLLKDARWLVHKEWVDLDELKAIFPQHKTLLENCSDGWQFFAANLDDYDIVQVNAFDDFKHFSRYRQRTEWYDVSRRQVKMYEVWYRVPAMAVVMHLGPTRRVLYDPSNQYHVNLVASKRVQITKSLTSQVRCSLYAGPHRLQDFGTRRRVFPYVPFFAYRDDQDRTPYGLVEGMIGPQDEYNSRRFRINWLLRARQVEMDADALDTDSNSLKEVLGTMMRPDQTVITNPNRVNKNREALTIRNALVLQKEQVEVMQDAKQLIQDVPGVYGSQLGQASSGVTSGIANSLLIEQGAVAMGDLNDNYRDSRQLAHEILLDQIIEDHSKQGLQIKIGTGSSRRVVVLNDFDEQGNIVNNMADAAIRVGLGEVPSTPAFRMQQQQQIATIIGALQGNPQAVAVLSPAFVESTDLPNRVELADDLRRASGIPTAGDKQAQQQMQAKQQQQAAQQEQMAQKAAAIAIEGEAAKVEETKSKTELNNAKAVEIGHGMAVAQHAPPGTPPDEDDDPDRHIDAALEEALAG